MVECSSKSFYFMGLTGVGMASIARVLVRFGYKVSGWDDNPDPKILKLLTKEGVDHIHWDDIEHVDCMVYSTAISEEHPGFMWFKSQLLPIYHRSDILAWLSNRIPTIAVCGSHGKTTTTSMIHHVFKTLDIPHVVILGGILNGEVGGQADLLPQWLVIEACESDRTFLKYHAKYVILTGLSEDHLEYYDHDMSQLIDAFAQWINKHEPSLLLPSGHDSIYDLMDQLSVPCKQIGHGSKDYHTSYRLEGLHSHIDLTTDQNSMSVCVPAPGTFNATNAAMVLALMDMIGVPIWNENEIFESYKRVERRFEYEHLKANDGKSLHWISDYGHHPKELKAMINTVREIWPGCAVKMIFEPHRYSRTHALFSQFAEVLSAVDDLLILPIYEASETPIEGISSKSLASSIDSPRHQAVEADNLFASMASWKDGENIILFQGAGTVHGHALRWLALNEN